ncbi:MULTISPECIES: phage tail tape measure protein [Rhizobium]|nr:phage tail tape measure protein [Rhizobium rosettiformans]
MNLDVIVRMRDLLSGPLRRLRSSLEGIASFSRRIGILGAAVAGISFLGPIDQAAAFQQKLLDIAGTMEMTGGAAFAFTGQAKEEYEALALLVGQSSDIIASGAGQMIAAGVNKQLIDASIGDIGRAATAANAEFSDMASVATSLLMTLRVPADQLDDSLGALVTAGKLGSFELKDMARYFPTLTSQMAKFGVTGREAVNFLASALQIARKGTSDPAEAANNLKNFLAKILAPATIKNFKDAGVDIEAVMQDAAVKGINPIEAVIQKIAKLTGISGKEIDGLMQKAKANGLEGAEALGYVREQLEKIYGAGKLGEIFGDMQVMDFLIPMLGNLDEYKQIRDEVAKATGEIIDEDFETQMKGLNRQMEIFREIGRQAWREVGFAFGLWMPLINQHLQAAIKWLRDLDRETGGMVRQALSFAGATLILVAALGALGFVLPAVGSGMAALAMPFIGTGRLALSIGRYFATAARSAIALQATLAAMSGARFTGLSRVAVGLRGMAMAVPGLAALKAALLAIGAAIAGITWPIWAAIAAVAALGLAIYNYWEPIKNFAQGFASVIGGALSELTGKLSNLAGMFASGNAKMAGKFAAWLGFDEAEIAAMSGKIEAFASSVVGFIKAIPGQVKGFLSDIFTMNDYSTEAEAAFRTAGERAGQAMVDAIKGAIDTLIGWFQGLGQRILDAVGKIDLSGIISWPSPSSWFGGGEATPAQPANQNMLPAQGGSGQASVGGQIDIRVNGPAQVTNTSSDNPNVPIRANTGRVVGRD